LNYSKNKKLLEKDKKEKAKEGGGGLGYMGLQARRRSIFLKKTNEKTRL
jgi:hypothetical protein